MEAVNLLNKSLLERSGADLGYLTSYPSKPRRTVHSHDFSSVVQALPRRLMPAAPDAVIREQMAQALRSTSRAPAALPANPSASSTSSLGRNASRATLFDAAPDLSRPSVLIGASDCCRPLPLDCGYSGASNEAGAEMQEGSGSNFDESDMFSDLPAGFFADSAAQAFSFSQSGAQETTRSKPRGMKRSAVNSAERRVRGKAETEPAAKEQLGASGAGSPSTSLPWWVLEALGEEEGEGEVDCSAPMPISSADSACSAAASGGCSRSRMVGLTEAESPLARESSCNEERISAEGVEYSPFVLPASALSGTGACAWSETLDAEDIGALLQAELCAFTARSVVGEAEGSVAAEGTLDDLCADDVLRAHCFADEAEIGGELEAEVAEGELQQWEMGGLGMWCWDGRLTAC